MLNQIISTIIALLLSDLYIGIYKKYKQISLKRINKQREAQFQDFGFPPIEENKKFTRFINISIIVCVIIGIATSWQSLPHNSSLLEMIKDKAIWGIVYLLIVANVTVVSAKVRQFYYIVIKKDPYYNNRIKK